MSKFWLLGGAVIIVGVALYFIMMGNKTSTPAPVPTPTPEPGKTIIKNTVTTAPVSPMTETIQLLEQNDSSESGTAVLTEKDGKTVVTLTMTGENIAGPQPAHIHIGPCPDVGSIVYPLTNVVNGKSETTLNVTLAKLATQQPLGLNVHKSVPEMKVYVACGNLALPTVTSTTSPAPTGHY